MIVKIFYILDTFQEGNRHKSQFSVGPPIVKYVYLFVHVLELFKFS